MDPNNYNDNEDRVFPSEKDSREPTQVENDEDFLEDSYIQALLADFDINKLAENDFNFETENDSSATSNSNTQTLECVNTETEPNNETEKSQLDPTDLFQDFDLFDPQNLLNYEESLPFIPCCSQSELFDNTQVINLNGNNQPEQILNGNYFYETQPVEQSPQQQTHLEPESGVLFSRLNSIVSQIESPPLNFENGAFLNLNDETRENGDAQVVVPQPADNVETRLTVESKMEVKIVDLNFFGSELIKKEDQEEIFKKWKRNQKSKETKSKRLNSNQKSK